MVEAPPPPPFVAGEHPRTWGFQYWICRGPSQRPPSAQQTPRRGGTAPFQNAGASAPLGTPELPPLWECWGLRPLGTARPLPMWERRGLLPFGNAGASAPLGMLVLWPMWERRGLRPFGNVRALCPFGNAASPPLLWVCWGRLGFRSFGNAKASAHLGMPGLPPLREHRGFGPFENPRASVVMQHLSQVMGSRR